MRLIVDVSIALAWNVAQQSTTLTTEAAAYVTEHGALVPFHFHLELTNALLVLERRRRLSRADVDHAIENIRMLDVEIDDGPGARIDETVFPLARRYQLSTYDAAYLELALRTELHLATRDGALAAASKKSGAHLFAG